MYLLISHTRGGFSRPSALGARSDTERQQHKIRLSALVSTRSKRAHEPPSTELAAYSCPALTQAPNANCVAQTIHMELAPVNTINNHCLRPVCVMIAVFVFCLFPN